MTVQHKRKSKPVQCARFLKAKKVQCDNVGVIHYIVEDAYRKIYITYSLCRKHSPNVLPKNRKKLGDDKFA